MVPSYSSSTTMHVNVSKIALSIDRVQTKEGKVVKFSHKDYPLRSISEAELCELRFSNIPAFVYKESNSLYACRIPKSLRFLNISCNHLCSSCKRVLNFADKDLGCPKILDRSMTEAQRMNNNIEAFEDAKRIEKYPFIINGFESLHTKLESFIVYECSLYQEATQKKQED